MFDQIGDFGLSHDLDDQAYRLTHGSVIPVRWTAPEVNPASHFIISSFILRMFWNGFVTKALAYGKYSQSSDVWSYGVVLYEIWALGKLPYEGWTNSEVVDNVEKGYRLPVPPICPHGVCQLMTECWYDHYLPFISQIAICWISALSGTLIINDLHLEELWNASFC